MLRRRSYLYANIDDIGLFNLIREGDHTAFTEIYNRYSGDLYLFVFFYVKDEELTQDVLQHIFMSLWENRRQINIKTSFKNFLLVAAKNHVLNQIRAQRIRLRFVSDRVAEGQGSMATPEEIFEQDEVNRILELAISDLRHDLKREILRLRREGLSNKDVAKQLNVPENTVKTYYAQTLKTLREHFKKQLKIVFLVCINLLLT